MAQERLNLEPEVQEILALIDEKKNFLLSGGAGSGKTYSLVQVIRQVISENPTAKVACMTYTNAAVKEIEDRVNHNNLNVSTIHDFLWDVLKHFQKELKTTLITLLNTEDSGISIDIAKPIPENYFDELQKGIQYKEFLKMSEGIISHDELLIVAKHMFDNFPKLSDIVKDKYKFIFIDEYQDTNKAVVGIFLISFKRSRKQNIIGFFGDAMQSIYNNTIGDLTDYVGDANDSVFEVKKEQNRRNPQLIINLANKLRTDGLIQEPSSDLHAPNMHQGQVKQGSAKFYYSTYNKLDEVKQILTGEGWDFRDTKETKELNLTHNLIATKAGIRHLMDIYDSDPILSFKNDLLKKIRDDKKKPVPQFNINENDTFDIVATKVNHTVRGRGAIRDEIMNDPAKNTLYNELKDELFSEVKKMYFTKEFLIDDKKQDEEEKSKVNSQRDNLIKHLFKIQNNIHLYTKGLYNEFLRVTDFRIHIKNINDKRILKSNIESLVNVGSKTIEEVINEADQKQICIIDDRLRDFKDKNCYLYNRVKKVKFKEFQNLYNYLEGKTPFSTQHKTKGTEFNNVLVILDNGNWNQYNFESMFLERGTDTVIKRSRKIFYVCCTRAKENLAVYYCNPKAEVINKAKEWFGNENVIPIV